MSIYRLGQPGLVAFVLVDVDGLEVPGLGTAFDVEISKNGGAFTAGLGIKAEIGDGWYSYMLTSTETNTAGPLAVKVTAVGAVQQNLLHTVRSSLAWEPGEGPNVLTTTEAAAVLRCEEDDPNMLMLLPQVDAYLRQATGRAWEEDEPISEEAKSAARMLLVQWHENPGMIANGQTGLSFGLPATLMQLKMLGAELAETEGSL